LNLKKKKKKKKKTRFSIRRPIASISWGSLNLLDSKTPKKGEKKEKKKKKAKSRVNTRPGLSQTWTTRTERKKKPEETNQWITLKQKNVKTKGKPSTPGPDAAHHS
jgi:hypothetical protein